MIQTNYGPQKRLERRHILLVEDDPDIVALVRRWLGRVSDCQLHVATDGVKGYAMACERYWFAVLVDHGLPGVKGFSLCRFLKAAAPTTRVVLTTADVGFLDHASGLGASTDDFLLKPFRKSPFLESLGLSSRSSDPTIPAPDTSLARSLEHAKTLEPLYGPSLPPSRDTTVPS